MSLQYVGMSVCLYYVYNSDPEDQSIYVWALSLSAAS
jgi:hypothetical protein